MAEKNTAPRPTPEQIAERDEKIVKMRQQGLNGREIGRKLGLAPSTVYRSLHRHGEYHQPKQGPSYVPRKVGRVGGVCGPVAAQGPEFMAWLAGAVPEGLTVAEFLVSCAVDVFHEEKEAESVSGKAA